MDKKRFSTANLVVLFTYLSFIGALFYKNPWKIDMTEKILFSISASCFAALAFLRFPLYFIANKPEDIKENLYNEKYSSQISFFKHLIYLFLTLEKSDLESLFNPSILKLYKKDRICKFVWDKSGSKFRHKFLDICFLPAIIFTSVIFARILIKIDIFSFFIFDLIILILFDRKNLILYAMSVKTSENIYIIYPYSSSKLKIFKYYGFAFMKKIFVTADTYRLNPVIKNYTVAHEAGHIKNNLISLINRVILVFNLFFSTLSPFFIRDFLGLNNPVLFFVPGLLVLVYMFTLRSKIIEYDEFTADKFAVDQIGKENCIEALNLLKKDVPKRQSSLIEKIFPRNVSFERRIKAINDYKN